MANDFNPYIPEWWAMGALAVLNENLITLPLFNRDYSDSFARGGQIINTRRPWKMTATRKAKSSPIVAQDVGADNVAIPLDQHVYNSFSVHDLDQQWSMEDLIATYLRPAGFALAKTADSIVLAQAAQFLLAGNVVGTPTQSVYENIVDGRVKMDNQLAPSEGRNMIVNPLTEGKLLKDKVLYQVNTSGGSGALRNGQVGDLSGIGLFKTQNLISNPLLTTATGVQTLTTTAASLANTATVTGNQTTVATVVGDWVSIGGIPYKVTAIVGGSDPRTFTLNRNLTQPVASGDKLYVYKGCTLNASYAVGYSEEIVLAPAANQYTPSAGDFVDIKGKLYGVVAVNTANSLLLDRPLEDAVVAGTDLVRTVPPGNYNWLAQRDALTVVLRTLAPTKPGTGALSAVASYNGLGVRAQMWYSGVNQTMQISLDFLMGIKVLDTNMGALVVS